MDRGATGGRGFGVEERERRPEKVCRLSLPVDDHRAM
jgi:hypothetical protein